MGWKHKIKSLDSCPVFLSTVWTGNMSLCDIVIKILCWCFISCPIYWYRKVWALFKCFLHEFISSMTSMTFSTLHERIRKTTDMSWCNPDIWIHHEGRVKKYHIFSFLDELLYPKVFDIFLQEGTEWTIVPRVRETSIDFRSLVDKTFCFRKGDECRHFERRHKRES